MIRPQNPFSLYDFLGYFIPGSLGVYFAIFVHFHIKLVSINDALFKEMFGIFSTHTYLPFILVSYVAGHFLSYLSSITVEKYSVWQHLYPSKYILGFNSYGYFYAEVNPTRRKIGRLFNAFFLLPMTLMDIVFGKLLNLWGLYLKSVDEILKNILKDTVIQINYKSVKDPNIFSYNITHPDEWLRNNNFFRICYHYALEQSNTHVNKMQNYVALFGFTRTMTLIFSLISWTFFIHVFIALFNNQCSINLHIVLYLALSSSCLTYSFYLAYNKFFRRFSLEVMLAATIALNFPNRGFAQTSSQQITSL